MRQTVRRTVTGHDAVGRAWDGEAARIAFVLPDAIPATNDGRSLAEILLGVAPYSNRT